MTWSWRTGSNWEGSTEILVLWGRISSRYCTYYSLEMFVLQNKPKKSAAPWALVSSEVDQKLSKVFVCSLVNGFILIISLFCYFEEFYYYFIQEYYYFIQDNIQN